MRKSAFTLIELLVVIAIIAILAAILFPVFAQAKLAAKQTSSLSNNKQVTLSHIMYVTDYDDSQVQYWWTNSGPEVVSWMELVNPYVKNKGVFLNPGQSETVNDFYTLCTGAPNPRVVSHWTTPMWIKYDYYNWSFVAGGTQPIMFAGFPVENNAYTSPAGRPCGDLGTRPWAACIGFPKVEKPAEVAVVIPGFLISYDRAATTGNQFGWPCVTGFGPIIPPNGPINQKIQVYREGGNYGMADGHAKWFSCRNMNGNTSHPHIYQGATYPGSPFMQVLD